MKQNTSVYLLSLHPIFYLIVLLGAFLILLGVSFDFTWLINTLSSYTVDGHCDPCNPITSFDMILPTIGATVILFAVIYQKELV